MPYRVGRMKQTASDNLRLVPAETLQADLGISRTTFWRWRKSGWIKTIQIAGRSYITISELERFYQRAAQGEFSAPSIHPKTEHP
jgi:hypothetical protein